MEYVLSLRVSVLPAANSYLSKQSQNKCYKKVSKVLNFTIEKFEIRCYNQMQIFDTKRY